MLAALEADDMEALADALTVRQKRFCEEYIIDYNANKAVVRAGYTGKWTDRQAYILMKLNRGIRVYIDHLLRSREARITIINPDYVVQRVVAIINDEEVKPGDKLRGLELLARHLGMFIDRTEVSGPDGGPIEMKQVEEAASEFIRNLKQLSERAKDKVDVTLV